MEDKNRKQEKFIKENIKMESPSADFSQKIMRQIISEEALNEKALFTLLKKHALDLPSVDFTDKVMDKIEVKNSSAFVYEPVISKKVWLLIAGMLISIVVFSFVKLDGQSEQFDYLGEFIKKLDIFYSFQLPEVFLSPILALGLFTMSLFLWVDYFIRNRHNTHGYRVI